VHAKKGGCVTALPPCDAKTDVKCGKGVCDEANHVCVPCLKSSDCGKAGYVCSQRQCVATSNCQSSADCKATKQVCEKTAGVCVDCVTTDDCATDEQCVESKCVAAPKCKSDKDCNVVCNKTTGVCVGCLASGDCKAGNYCAKWGQCVAAACSGQACFAGKEVLFGCQTDGSGYAAGTSCIDAEVCTADTCDAVKGCQHAAAADNSGCDDGDACSLGDMCQSGVCKGGPPKSCGAAEACAGGVCQPSFMSLIPAGVFKMGCVAGDSQCSESENPQHAVTLDAFYMDVFEVSVAKYKACVDAGKCTAPSGIGFTCNWGVVGKAQHPVNCVNWSQADAYCKWTDSKAHLPTEAQWEKAARGGAEGKVYPWGDTLDCDHAVWNDDKATTGQGCDGDGTMAVGSKPVGKNGYGLYDMAGNVWEWTADWYDETYYGVSPAANPSGPASGSIRVQRGGGFGGADYLRASVRGDFYPSVFDDLLGFRCSRSFP